MDNHLSLDLDETTAARIAALARREGRSIEALAEELMALGLEIMDMDSAPAADHYDDELSLQREIEDMEHHFELAMGLSRSPVTRPRPARRRRLSMTGSRGRRRPRRS